MKEHHKEKQLSMTFKCDQRWEDMQPCEGSRFCNLCKKTVYDFRGLTAAEVTRRHLEMGGKVCGIYDKKIIKDGLVPPPANFAVWRTARPYVLSFLGLFTAGAAGAQTVETDARSVPQPSGIAVVQETEKSSGAQSSIHKNQGIYLRGRILNEQGKPLFRMKVQASGGEHACETDEQGMFLLEVTDLFQQADTLQLDISGPGYLPLRVQAVKSKMPEERQKLSFLVYEFGEQRLQIDPAAIVFREDWELKGRVTDSLSGEALIGVPVVFYYNGDVVRKVLTDFQGNFSMEAPEGIIFRDTDEIKLEFMYVGYESKVYTFTAAEFADFVRQYGQGQTESGEVVMVELEQGTWVMGAIACPVKRPLHKRIWYKITRPFRRYKWRHLQ